MNTLLYNLPYDYDNKESEVLIYYVIHKEEKPTFDYAGYPPWIEIVRYTIKQDGCLVDVYEFPEWVADDIMEYIKTRTDD